MAPPLPGTRRAACAGLALLALAACAGGPLDLDLRDLGEGFSTAPAVRAAPSRPAPDSRGVISTPTYQVAVARGDDTVTSIAGRLGLDAAEVAAYNGLAPDAVLRRDELVALPTRVAAATAAPSPAAPVAAAPPPTPGAVTTTTLAAAPGSVLPPPAAAPAAPAAPAPAPSGPPPGADPVRHQVVRGETAYSIARLYGIPVGTVAEWNGLGPDLAVREGQFLLVPAGAAPAAVASVEEEATPPPGAGSETPVPPSAATPLPDAAPPPAAEVAEAPPAAPQDLGEAQAPVADTARMVMPALGSIIRAYAPGRNEGIDIGAPAGTPVRAADGGTVAAVTTNTEGVNIVVLKHAGELLTVYTHIEDLQVAKDDTVARGETIGQVRAGDPSFLHFEVRRGMASADPATFLP